VRLQATHQLVERGGNEAVAALQPILKNIAREGDGPRKAHALWVLERLGKLDDETLASASSATEKEVRVHAQRILTEKTKWSPRHTAIGCSAWREMIPWSSASPSKRWRRIRPSITSSRSLRSCKDSCHRYAPLLCGPAGAARATARRGDWKTLKLTDWPQKEQRAIANVCVGVHNEPSAEFLKSYVERYEDSIATTREYTHYIVRRGNTDSIRWALAHTQKQFADNLGAQGVILKGIVQPPRSAASLFRRMNAHRRGHRRSHAGGEASRDAQAGVDLADAMKLAKAQPRLLALATKNQDIALGKACVKGARQHRRETSPRYARPGDPG